MIASIGLSFDQIELGYYNGCGIVSDGRTVCWGSDGSGQSTFPPDEEFVQVSAGGRHSCGLQSDGGVVCWGEIDNHVDDAQPYPGGGGGQGGGE